MNQKNPKHEIKSSMKKDIIYSSRIACKISPKPESRTRIRTELNDGENEIRDIGERKRRRIELTLSRMGNGEREPDRG